jgi:GAF domain-containing protein
MSEADGIAPAGVGNGSGSALAGRAVRAERRAELLGRVIKAGVRVGSEIGLDQVLVRIVEAGCELTGARYGAFGVLDLTGTELAEFVTVGISAEERRRLGDLPRGRGILGAVSRDATALRLDAIYEDPRSAGFPPGHPPMQSFLGVPIVVREAPFGNLYLTERRDGPFTAQDEEAFTLLAAQAGVVVEHARMVEASRRWSEQLEALADVASAFTREIDVESLLNVIADQLLGVVDARSVVIELLEPGGQLRAAVVAGDRAERVVVGAVAPAGSKARRVLGRRRSERVGTTLDDPEIDPHGAAAKLGIRSGCGSPWSREEGRLGSSPSPTSTARTHADRGRTPPPTLDDFGLIPALERLAQATTTNDLRVEFVAVLTDIRLPPAVETATYRIVQEAITNAVKHTPTPAPSASASSSTKTTWDH